MQQRRLDERRLELVVEPQLRAEQEAEHGDVDRVAIGQVLVLLHRENLSERRVAARDLVNEQLHEVAYRHRVERLPGCDRLEGFLRAHERLGVRGIEIP